MILIVGNGRSGTNLLGQILNSHPEIVCDIEKQPQFDYVTKSVVYKDNTFFNLLIKRYIHRIKQVKPKIFASKDHHAIWLAEKLLKELDITFIYIERNAFAVVASSLLHSGVKNWVVQKFPQNPLSANTVPEYGKLSVVERLTLRWTLHWEEFDRLSRIYPEKFYYIKYENLVVNPKKELYFLQKKLGLNTVFEIPYIKPNTLNKWKIQLTEKQKRLIKLTLDRYLYYPN